MPLDLATALNSYGYVGQLANSIPELRGILDQAMREQWVPSQVDRAIQDSPWWKANADSARNQARLYALDPATYTQNLNNLASKIRMTAAEMGRDAPGVDWSSLARRSLVQGYDEQQIRFIIGTELMGTPLIDGVPTGQAGQIQGHIRQLAESYGVPATNEFISTALVKIQSGMDTMEGFENVIKARAKAAFPQFAAQIDAGMTVRDIADPYISTYAQTLEVPETEVTLRDSFIQRALSQPGPDASTRTAMPLWQFQRQLKDDPRYDNTRQAKDDAFSALAKIGRDWGFVGDSA